MKNFRQIKGWKGGPLLQYNPSNDGRQKTFSTDWNQLVTNLHGFILLTDPRDQFLAVLSDTPQGHLYQGWLVNVIFDQQEQLLYCVVVQFGSFRY